MLDTELDTELQVRFHKSGVEEKNHLPQPSGHTACDTAQDTVGFQDCKRQQKY